MLVGVAWVLPLLSCGGSEAICEASASQAECLYEAIQEQPATGFETVYTLAIQVEDTVVRRAAVSKWMREHALELEEVQGERLCKLLRDDDQVFCFRRLRSPHLR